LVKLVWKNFIILIVDIVINGGGLATRPKEEKSGFARGAAEYKTLKRNNL